MISLRQLCDISITRTINMEWEFLSETMKLNFKNQRILLLKFPNCNYIFLTVSKRSKHHFFCVSQIKLMWRFVISQTKRVHWSFVWVTDRVELKDAHMNYNHNETHDRKQRGNISLLRLPLAPFLGPGVFTAPLRAASTDGNPQQPF